MRDYGSILETLINQHCDHMVGSDGWISISPLWETLQRIGAERDLQKSSYASTKNWSRSSTHFLGLVGEAAVSILTGIPINVMLCSMGDGCRDFCYSGVTIDVKGTLYWTQPHLKQYPNPKRWCDIYILVGIDQNRQRARLSGWATAAEVQASTMVDYGYGPQRSIPHGQLHQGLPPMLPTRTSLRIK